MEIIHFILGKANPARMNGVNKVVDRLATWQQALGHQVAIWGITPSPESPGPKRDLPLQLFRASQLPFALDRSLKAALKSLSRETVFHLHGGFVPEMYRFARLLSREGFAYVFTPHGSYNAVAMEKSGFRKKIYFECFEKHLLRRAKAVHCLGKSEFKAMSAFLPTEQLICIPNGQDALQDHFEQVSGGEEEPPVFSFCGRLRMKTKGLDLLLEGFARYCSHREEPGELVLIGDGEDRPALEARAQALGIADRVRFMGSRYGEEKDALLKETDVFYLTSRNEGLPTGVLEAAALGLPCVVSDATNMADYIHAFEAGLALEENGPEQIAASMHTVAVLKRQGLLPTLGRNAFHMIQTEFTWERIVQRMIQAYQN